jgi:dihydropyrimidinase
VTVLPRFVFSRGEPAVEEAKVSAQPGHGKFVAREPHAAVSRALSTWKELVAPRRIERTGIPATGV